MFNHKSISALGLAIALGAPIAGLAGGFWEQTNDEAGNQVVAPKVGRSLKGAPIAATSPDQLGDVSTDRQYVFLGESSGWQLRPMQFRIEGGRFVHVDDPAGHMDRLADTRSLTDQERTTRERSGGG